MASPESSNLTSLPVARAIEFFKNQRLIVNQKQIQVRICMTDSSNHFIAMAEKILLPFNTPDFEVVNL